MDKKIFCGRGKDIPYADFMNFINTSFDRLDHGNYFLSLLPKLYREEYRPQDSNYVVTENGVAVAAVGAYDHALSVCGRTLSCRGIGNVAVHPEHRSKGYMNIAMDAAMKDMISDGIALSALGGQRQRYGYFGYDNAGLKYTYSVSRNNIRHAYRDLSAPYRVIEITDPADPIIDAMIGIAEKSAYLPVRPRERYLDFARSWTSRLVSVLDGERFVGYCILDKNNSVSEVGLVDDSEFIDLVRSVFGYLGEGFNISLPPHLIGYRRALDAIAERATLSSACNFNILNYRAVIDAFLALKLSYESLPDGEVTLLIHGYSGDERIRISVGNGRSRVEYVDGDASVELELDHADATSMIFSPISSIRELSNPLVKLWFPLPLCMYNADKV